MSKFLQIDIETYSATDLSKCGVYRYVQDPSFEILLFAYAYDDEEVVCIDLTKDMLPDEVLYDLMNPEIIKTAQNANFERTCISKYFGIRCNPRQWHCTMVHGLEMGLPGSLEKNAQVLNLEAQKDSRGKNLIKYFSVPCKPTKVNGGRTRNLPEHDIEKWNEFISYCVQDVEVERAIRRKLARFPMSESEHELWAIDQDINDYGVRLDPVLIREAIRCDELFREETIKAAQELTGLANPNSNTQLRDWLSERGLETPNGIGKEQMASLLNISPSDEVTKMLTLRQELGKTSVDKYNAMQRCICGDDRARGLLQFYGANRTGRWAGRLVQVQNLPQNKIKDLSNAREVLRSGDLEYFEMLYGTPSFPLSQLIRTAFIPSEGRKFIVADFSAIEARVIAWLADERWVIEVFKGHGKIYEATASQMFGVPIETIEKGEKNYHLRAKGKVATLACGYQGGTNALIAMGALKSGIPEDELPGLVSQWRDSNPNIRNLWYATERAAVKAVEQKTIVELAHGVRYRYEAGILFADLPSGRSLSYLNARLKPDPSFNKMGIVFDGMDQVKKQWTAQRTYGGKLVENLVQAIARDCLAENIKRIHYKGYDIVMHVHDEVVIDAFPDMSVEDVCALMGQPIKWAPGLPLRADGYECDFYMKD